MLGFLERKFPDKVVVTTEDYAKLNAAMKGMEKITEARILHIEAEIGKLNIATGFVGPAAKSPMGAFQR